MYRIPQSVHNTSYSVGMLLPRHLPSPSQEGSMKDADERSAQLHLPFGALMIAGILLERRFMNVAA